MINAKIRASQDTYIEDVTFSASSGDILAITGGTNTSRNAILLSILGILPLERGCVSIDCEPVIKQTSAFYRQKTAFLPTNLDFGEEKVEDVLNYELNLKANKDMKYSREEITDELRQLAVPAEVLSKSFKALDKPVTQRIALAMAGLQRRKILILDNPTKYQDEDGTLSIMSYLCSSQMKEIAIVTATEDPAILSVCNKVVKLNN